MITENRGADFCRNNNKRNIRNSVRDYPPEPTKTVMCINTLRCKLWTITDTSFVFHDTLLTARGRRGFSFLCVFS